MSNFFRTLYTKKLLKSAPCETEKMMFLTERCGTGSNIGDNIFLTAWPNTCITIARVSFSRSSKYLISIHVRPRGQRGTVNTRSSAIAEGPRNASCQLQSCQLPRNSAETTCTTSPEQIEVRKLEGYSGPMCNKHVHSTMERSSRFHCPVGVINKPTTGELWIPPVY